MSRRSHANNATNSAGVNQSGINVSLARVPSAEKRRWQPQLCGDVADAAEIAVALVRSDAGDRGRACGMVTAPAPAGSVQLERGP